MTFSETENLIARYDAATTALDQAVTDRLSASIDASFRNLIRELERQYPTWQSEGSLYASQRRLLLVTELGALLDVINPAEAAQYQALLQDALDLSHTTGATLADELITATDSDYPLADFVTIPIEAAALQARDGVKRLSRYNEDFRNAASSVIEQGLIQGWGTKRVQGVLEKELGVTKSKAETLARTEVMSALNSASQQRYQENKIQWMMWQVTPSEEMCPVCAARDGNVYEVGKVSVPAHPRCRCIIAPIKPEWLQDGLIDTAAIAESRDKTQAEFIAGGGKLETGPTAWERKAGLTEAPKPVWRPGDAVEPRARPAVDPFSPEAKPAFPKTKPAPTPPPSVPHKPLMTEAEALEYTKTSVYQYPVYHGTTEAGGRSITTKGVDVTLNGKAVFGQGFYTAKNYDAAKFYADSARDGDAGSIVAMRVQVTNPKIVANRQDWNEYQASIGLDPYDSSTANAARVTAALKERGYDAVEVVDDGYVCVFDANQVAAFQEDRLEPEDDGFGDDF